MSKKGPETATEEPKNCFVIMPISDVEGYPSGHFAEVYSELIEPAVKAAGYNCSLANSTSAAHLIQLDVVTRIATAELCICDLSTNNPNVLFEYGIRQAFDKPTVLIKDDKTRRIFDLSGFRDIEYDHTLRIAHTLRARQQIEAAIHATVGGSEDAEQVFSLVKLMKLAKASFPTGEISRDDARFELLELKLDRLLEESVRQTKRLQTQSIPLNRSNDERYLVEFERNNITIFDRETGNIVNHNEMDSIMKSPFYRQLNSKERSEFISNMNQKTDIIPF